MTRSRPAALLLDLDGTLVDSEPIHRAAYRAFFADRGWDVADLALFTGRRAEDVFASEPGPWAGADPAGLAAGVVSHIRADAVPDAVGGARALVEAAAARGVHVAIVTSARSAWVELCLGTALDVLDLVEVVVTADDVVDGKPHPAGYALACRRLGVPASGCAAVEDSPAGVAAARAAGVLEVHGVSTTHPPASLLAAGARLVHADLTGLAATLGLTGRP